MKGKGYTLRKYYKYARLSKGEVPRLFKRVFRNATYIYEDKARTRLHCAHGPAVIYPNGTQVWYSHGQIHRAYGPAVLYPNGETETWKRGKLIARHPAP